MTTDDLYKQAEETNNYEVLGILDALGYEPKLSSFSDATDQIVKAYIKELYNSPTLLDRLYE